MNALVSRLVCRPLRSLALINNNNTFIKQCSTSVSQPVEVDFEEVRKGLEEKSLIYVDVRNKSELKSDGKVVGSINLPLPEIEEAFMLADDDFASRYGFPKPAKNVSNLVLGCKVGVRIFTAYEKLEKMGYKSIKVYKGSLLDWKAKGGPVE